MLKLGCIAGVAVITAVSLWYVSATPVTIADEQFHAYQILIFLRGEFRLYEWLTVLPGYHAAVFLLMKLFGLSAALAPMRIFSFLLALTAVPAFYRLACRTRGGNEAWFLTAQFAFMPWLFIFFFIIYTDAVSLALVLWMIERAASRRTRISAVLALLSLLVRQTNVLWVAFAVVMLWRQQPGLNLRLRFRQLWPYLPVFFAFAVFVLLNKGVAIGDATHHGTTLNPATVWFFLMVAFFTFPVQYIADAPRIWQLIRRAPWVLILIGALFFFYDYTYQRSHPYNYVRPDYFLRNAILYFTTEFPPIRYLVFVPAAWMCLAYAAAIWKSQDRTGDLILLGFIILSFLPLPLIDQRYYLTGLTLWLLREQQRPMVVASLGFTYAVGVSLWVTYRVGQGDFFL